MSHLITSGKQHNYRLYINYHKWTRNIKNNILLLQGFRKHSEKTMRTFLDTDRDNIGYVKEKQLEIENFLVI